ncbi:hypothetical protein VPBG_00089 [Vibrio phage helene 12B3]|uniref:hypothetical protein n=1 Tax=Vibrio phage helene 12B3 TaxID=573173 RepID=UPI0002C10E5A|nr:hypothetical protein VPBG_00089 [Vibrio phage helene 12B3]AGG57861.1 hypothetical protein VPBG_00089 [Vibrio phage helene 12B3]
MLLKPFTYRHSDGLTYEVEAEVTYRPSLEFNAHTAASRDDMLDDLTVEDIYVVDKHNEDVTMLIEVPDSAILRELELQTVDSIEEDQVTAYENQLTMKHIADECDWYREEMYNV